MKSQEVGKEYTEHNEAERRLRARMAEEEAATKSGGEHGDAPEEPADEDGGSPEQQRIAELETECEPLKDQMLRARAEFENYRKRTARDQERFRATATESVVHDLLPVMDNLELALKHSSGDSGQVIQGVEMVLKQMREALESHGLKLIPAHGERFDPNIHEAVGHEPSESVPLDHVLEEYQRGYFLGDMVLRPSRVLVSRGTEEPPAEANPNPETDVSAPEGSETEQGA